VQSMLRDGRISRSALVRQCRRECLLCLGDICYVVAVAAAIAATTGVVVCEPSIAGCTATAGMAAAVVVVTVIFDFFVRFAMVCSAVKRTLSIDGDVCKHAYAATGDGVRLGACSGTFQRRSVALAVVSFVRAAALCSYEIS